MAHDAEIDWYSFLERPRLPGVVEEQLTALRQTSILVTGAAGSIGRELSVRLASMQPKGLVLLDCSESALYRLQSELADLPLASQPDVQLGNVGDAALLAELFERHRPGYIFHAAAYKQVPLLEEHPLEAIQNNVLNTQTLAELARASGETKLILLSTDKAVEPISMLGATKRIAEQLVMASGGVALRLGNVLGTVGSVSEVFRRQICKGGPITLTGSEQRRFFLTREEAVDLLLVSAIEASASSIVAPVMERQYLIADLATFLVEALAPERLVSVHETAVRAGDKPFEQLWSAKENVAAKIDKGWFEIRHQASDGWDRLTSGLGELQDAVKKRDRRAALEIVRGLVPEYVPRAAMLSGVAAMEALR